MSWSIHNRLLHIYINFLALIGATRANDAAAQAQSIIITEGKKITIIIFFRINEFFIFMSLLCGKYDEASEQKIYNIPGRN